MAKDDQAPGANSEGARDVALIHGVTEEGDLRIVRQREDRLEFGAVRPLREGVPISGEVVRLTPRKEFPLLCDVKTELKVAEAARDDVAEPSAVAHKGPARVASKSYRNNWDLIWNRPSSSDDLAN
jgi:hypothetical protein